MSDIVKQILDLIDERIADEKIQLVEKPHNSIGQGMSMGAIDELTYLKNDIEELIERNAGGDGGL